MQHQQQKQLKTDEPGKLT